MTTDVRSMPQDEYMRTYVQPMLNQALEKVIYQVQLIEHVIDTDEIIQHQERLKEQKILDKLEQKRIDKERLKEELGSQYESSEEEDNDMFDHQVDMNAQVSDGEPENKEVVPEEEAQKKDMVLDDIAEDAVNENDEDEPEFLPTKKKEFNPILFLANKLQEIYDQNKK